MSCREDLNWPLMRNNIQQTDVDALVNFLQPEVPILTQASQVEAFEQEWSRWLGVEHSVFVNSGSSANLLTITALKETYGTGEIIVPTLTWVSDIASVIQCGFKPGLCGYQSAHAGDGHGTGAQENYAANQSGFLDPCARLQRSRCKFSRGAETAAVSP
jgi:hypothetical protein